jgi:hypothetical protein
MRTQEELEAYIKEVLISNNLDININHHPDLISAGKELGYDVNGLATVARNVYENTDWRPYKLIDEQVINSPSFAQGRFFNEDARQIVERVKADLSPSQAIAYIISIISREPHNFRPRLHPAPDTGSFRDPWMTDDAWHRYQQQNEPVEWCDMQAITVEQLGEICFQKKEESMQYLQSKVYLLQAVMLLTRSAARTQSFEKIFDEVKDPEMRYLTIIYRLNNDLPFRFMGRMYKTLAELMTDAFEAYESFSQLEAVYARGYMHVWQREAKTPAAAYLPAEYGKNGFLELLYKVNPQYPFFLNGQKYRSPAHLVSIAKTSGAVWKDVFQAIDCKELHSWFAGQGRDAWNEQIDRSLVNIFNSGAYNDEERKLAAVQAFIDMVDEGAVLPAIQATPEALSFMHGEASHVITSSIRLRLSSDGFVKASLRVEPEIAGVSLDTTTVKFYGLVENRQCDVVLTIDPMQLKKDTRYSFQVIVKSVYQELRLPMELSVVFPKKAYIRELVKWGLMGAGFFLVLGLLGYLFDKRTDYDVVTGDYIPFGIPYNYLPLITLGYLLLLILLIGGIILSLRYIRRKYKTHSND